MTTYFLSSLEEIQGKEAEAVALSRFRILGGREKLEEQKRLLNKTVDRLNKGCVDLSEKALGLQKLALEVGRLCDVHFP